MLLSLLLSLPERVLDHLVRPLGATAREFRAWFTDELP